MQRPRPIGYSHSSSSQSHNTTTNNNNNNHNTHNYYPNRNSNHSNTNHYDMSSSTSTSTSQSTSTLIPPTNWLVNDEAIRDVPSFYPLEKSSRYIHDRPSLIANRISECCRVMSVQAVFDHDLATANLKTCEHVEIHISLWKAPPTSTSTSTSTSLTSTDANNTNQEENNENENQNKFLTIVETQRRKGDPVTYHNYFRHILSAAEFGNYPSTTKNSPSLSLYPYKISKTTAASTAAAAAAGAMTSSSTTYTSEASAANLNVVVPSAPLEDALLALEIAASLLKKDRMDARQLGMETLCLLTDYEKAGKETALIASKVVLFGSVDAYCKNMGESGTTLLSEDGEDDNEDEDDDDEEDFDYMPVEDLGVREAVLSLVQFGRLGEHGDLDDLDHVGGSGVGGGSAGGDMIGGEILENGSGIEVLGGVGGVDGAVAWNGGEADDLEFNALLHNLALAVLANSLDVLGRFGNQMALLPIGNDNAQHTDVATATAAAATTNKKKTNNNTMEPTTNANTFLSESKEISKRELLATLLNVLSKADSKPHDACLSAQCLRSLFQASKQAKRKARDLKAKQIVSTALDVARRTHVKLENETKNIIKELQNTDDLDEQRDDENRNQHQQQEEDSDDGENSDGNDGSSDAYDD